LDKGEPFVVGSVLAQPGSTVGVHIVPDDNDRGAELQVRADQEVAVVLPGETLACAFEEQVEAGPVDQPGPFARPVAAHRGDRDPSPGPSTHSDHGSLPARPHVRARGGVIANPASSSKAIQASSAAAVLPPAATRPSSRARLRVRHVPARVGPGSARTSRGGAAAATLPRSSNGP
jgi:hypothetical protein